MSFPALEDNDIENGLELPAMAEEEQGGGGFAAATTAARGRRNKFILGTALLTFGLAAAVVGGVCGHRSGQCRPPRQTVVASVTTDLQPTPWPSSVPSQAPSDQPSSQPSDLPSAMPSDVPTSLPTLLPTSGPSQKPSTRRRTSTAAPVVTTEPAEPLSTTASSVEEAGAAAQECQLLGCFLRNLDTGSEQRLDRNAPTSYTISTTSTRNGSITAVSRYSIRCDYTSQEHMKRADFYLATTDAESSSSTSTTTLYHREHDAPFWMQSNSPDWIEPVPYLSTCNAAAAVGAITSNMSQKTIRVAATAATDENANNAYCSDVSFQLIAQCNNAEDEEEKLMVTTTTTTSSIVPPSSAVAAASEEEVVAVVEEPASVPVATTSVVKDEPIKTDSCAMACYLHDITAGVDIVLEETGTTAYTVAADGSSRYSIRCDTGHTDDQPTSSITIAYAKFFYNEQSHREFNAPFWMQSNSSSSTSGGSAVTHWIVAVPYLTACVKDGDNHVPAASSKKTVRVALATNNDGEESYCRDVTFDLTAQCH